VSAHRDQKFHALSAGSGYKFCYVTNARLLVLFKKPIDSCREIFAAEYVSDFTRQFESKRENAYPQKQLEEQTYNPRHHHID
jgi:hypothetical protein